MTTDYPMTKSPRAVAKEALRLAREALPAYSSKYSRKDFTSKQSLSLRESRESKYWLRVPGANATTLWAEMKGAIWMPPLAPVWSVIMWAASVMICS